MAEFVFKCKNDKREEDCDVFIDCTNTDAFMNNNLPKYYKINKPLVIATTAFSEADKKEIYRLSKQVPVFMTGNFSIALHDFIETLKFAARRISRDTDVQIVEYHHSQKKDAPSGTALMIRVALVKVMGYIVWTIFVTTKEKAVFVLT